VTARVGDRLGDRTFLLPAEEHDPEVVSQVSHNATRPHA
jgi:hypothetical protein